MYNVILYDSIDEVDNQYAGTRVTFDTLNEAFKWAEPALEQGSAVIITPVKE